MIIIYHIIILKFHNLPTWSMFFWLSNKRSQTQDKTTSYRLYEYKTFFLTEQLYLQIRCKEKLESDKRYLKMLWLQNNKKVSDYIFRIPKWT